MKKLAFIAVVACAMMSHAATYSWSLSSGAIFDGTGTTGKSSGTIYLFFADTYAQSSLVSSFADNSGASFDITKAIASTTLGTDGKFAATEVSSTAVSADATAYMAIIFDSRLFVSATTTAVYDEMSEGSIIFGSQAYLSRYNNNTATLLPDNDAAAGYVGAGWYAVPEPTSGLLLLIGVGMMALKRKRA